MEAPFVYGAGELRVPGGASGVSFYSPTMTVHRLPSASLSEALETVEEEVDCSLPCWRRVDGGGPCECEEGDEGTWHDGC